MTVSLKPLCITVDAFLTPSLTSLWVFIRLAPEQGSSLSQTYCNSIYRVIGSIPKEEQHKTGTKDAYKLMSICPKILKM